MNKITIITEDADSKTTFIKEGSFVNLSEVLEALEAALRGSGWSFKGRLTIEDEGENT